MSGAEAYRVRRFTTADKSRWDDFVTNSKNGTFLLMRDYMDYHADRFVDWSLLVFQRASDRLVALLPANRLDHSLVSHGGLTYGGLITSAAVNTSAALEIFAAVIEHCRSEGIAELVYKSVPSIYHTLPAEEDKYALFYYGAELYLREVLSVVDLGANVEITGGDADNGARKARTSRSSH